VEVFGHEGELVGALETGPLESPGFVTALVLRRAAALSGNEGLWHLEGAGSLGLLHACLRAQFLRAGGRPAPLRERPKGGRALGVLAAGLRAAGSGEELGLVLERKQGGTGSGGAWELVSVCTEDELPGGRRGWVEAEWGIGGAAANERAAAAVAGRFARAAAEGHLGGGRAGGVFRNLLLAAVGNEGGKVPDSSGKEAQDAVSAVAALEDSYFRRCEESLRTAARERPGEAYPAQDLDCQRPSACLLGVVFPFLAPAAGGFRGWSGAVFLVAVPPPGGEEDGISDPAEWKFEAARLLPLEDARIWARTLVPQNHPWLSGLASRHAAVSDGPSARTDAVACAGSSSQPTPRYQGLGLLQLSPTPKSPLMAAVEEDRELRGASAPGISGDLEAFLLSELAGTCGVARGDGRGRSVSAAAAAAAAAADAAAFADQRKWSFSSRSSMSTADHRMWGGGGPSGSSRKSSFSSRKSSGTETGSLRILTLNAGRRPLGDNGSYSEAAELKGVSVSPTSSFLEDGSESEDEELTQGGRFPLHTRVRIPEFPEIFVHDFLSPQVQLQQQTGVKAAGGSMQQGNLKDTLSRMTEAFEASERYVAQRLSVLGTVAYVEVRENSLGKYYAVITMSDWADANVHRSLLGDHVVGVHDFYRGQDVAVQLHVKGGTPQVPPLPAGWIRLQCPGEKYAGKCSCGKVFTATRRPVSGFEPLCKTCAGRGGR